MSALSDYAGVVKRQWELLEYAESLDAITRFEPYTRQDGRRVWTRQDKRRCEYENQWEDYAAAGYIGDPPPITGRMFTRVDRVLSRWPAPDHRPALAEAAQNGTYQIVAPLVTALAEAHRLFRRRLSGKDYDQSHDGYSRAMPEREEIDEAHRRAVEALLPYLPTGPADLLPTGPADLKPTWNRDTGELTIDGRLAKRIRNLSQNGTPTNVVRILDTFQESDWPARIDDPLPFATDSERKRRLADTVKSLNDGISAMRFARDGTSEGIRWERAPSPGAPMALP